MESGRKRKFRLSFNAPAILAFAGICVIAQLISMLTGGKSDSALFSVYRSSMADPLTYLRCVCHVFGHAGWEHLIGNIMYILILGPMIEEKYGTRNTALIILATAVVTGAVNMIFFPWAALRGASGVVFAFILIASITTVREENAIPVTFVLVAVLYIGQQIWQGLFVKDNVSQMAHIVGGMVGSALGFALNRPKKSRY